jgi:hypothetical protein
MIVVEFISPSSAAKLASVVLNIKFGSVGDPSVEVVEVTAVVDVDEVLDVVSMDVIDDGLVV